jgi:hypothetical protein
VISRQFVLGYGQFQVPTEIQYKDDAKQEQVTIDGEPSSRLMTNIFLPRFWRKEEGNKFLAYLAQSYLVF